MIGEILEIVAGLASITVPSSRRDAFAWLAMLSAMPLFGLGAAAFIDLSSQHGSILDNYVQLPRWVSWGIPVSGVVFVASIIVIALDVRWERQATSRIGRRPRVDS